jgi:hypothetical protein
LPLEKSKDITRFITKAKEKIVSKEVKNAKNIVEVLKALNAQRKGDNKWLP